MSLCYNAAMDILIRHVTIMDGSGEPAYAGAVGMERGKLRLFRGAEASVPAARVIDGTGLTAVPGFIDAHSHGDLTMRGVYATASKITQGITTQVAGHCGVSMYPCAPGAEAFSRFSRFFAFILPKAIHGVRHLPRCQKNAPPALFFSAVSLTGAKIYDIIICRVI